jgi:cell division protein FtsN
VSPERHFEIIISGRQLAGVIALVAALLLVAFGLGVGVGLLEPRYERVADRAGAIWQPAPTEQMPADRVATPPTPEAVAALTGETVQPPALPADIVAATPPPAVVTSSPEPRAPSPKPAATPTPRPPLPTATPRPRPTATPRPTAVPQYWIQAVALTRADQAEGVRQRVMALGFRADQVLVLAGTGGKYRVRLGPFPDQESAGRVVARLHDSGFPDAFPLKE